jgi:RimJ/RimL family protein N-acetyltransferase
VLHPESSSVFASERLTYAPLELDEARAQLAGHGSLLPWGSGFPAEGDLNVARWFAQMADEGTPRRPPSIESPWTPWIVMLDGSAIGGVGFHGPPDAEGVVEIGYGIAEPHRGLDYATEAVIAHCTLGFERGARVVIAKTDPANVASHRVLAKAGFVADGPLSPGLTSEHLFALRAG